MMLFCGGRLKENQCTLRLCANCVYVHKFLSRKGLEGEDASGGGVGSVPLGNETLRVKLLHIRTKTRTTDVSAVRLLTSEALLMPSAVASNNGTKFPFSASANQIPSWSERQISRASMAR